MNTDPIDVEVTDVATGHPDAPGPQTAGAALVTTNSPYMAMATRAMEMGAVDQLDKLLDLQLKWDAARAARAFTAAMAAFKADPIVIEKKKLVEFTTGNGDTTSYRHATLAAVVDAVVAGMGKHGLSHRWDVKQEGGQVAVTCTVTHRDGHSEAVTMQAAPDASGKKNAIQQVASAVTYLQRYTLMAATGVAAADMQEDDGRSYGAAEVELITDEQLVTLTDLVDAYVSNHEAFMAWISKGAGQKIDSLAVLPASLYQRVHDELARIKKRKEEAAGG